MEERAQMLWAESMYHMRDVNNLNISELMDKGELG